MKTGMIRDIPDEFVPGAEWTPIEKPTELCVVLASGKADVLTGRYPHASSHDLDDLNFTRQ